MTSQVRRATPGQISEIVAQLADGQITGPQIQSVIEARVKLPEMGSIRETQARRLYDLFGSSMEWCSSFEEYLDGQGTSCAATPIPQLPHWDAKYLRHFGAQNVCLVDRRIFRRVSLQRFCELTGLTRFQVKDHELVVNHETPDVFWMLFQDGVQRRVFGRDLLPTTYAPFETGLDVAEGLSIWLQNPAVLDDHFMRLTRVKRKDGRDGVAYLGEYREKSALCWSFEPREAVVYGMPTRLLP